MASLIFSYSLLHVRVGAGNDPQPSELLDFEGTETLENHILNLPGTFFIQFLPDTGFHNGKTQH